MSKKFRRGRRNPIEPMPGGGFVASGPSATALYRLVALKHAMKLELSTGMKMSRGINPFAIVKQEFGLKGNKQKIYDQFVAYLEKVGPGLAQNPRRRTKKKIPAAACPVCGGWTSFGGMSQYATSRTRVMGRRGCACFGRGRVKTRLLRRNPSRSRADIDRLVQAARQQFGSKFHVKPGYEWESGSSAILWSGEGAVMPGGIPAFDSYAEDPQERTYIMGVHKDLVAWAKKHGLFWEPYDAGTYMAYQENSRQRRRGHRNPYRAVTKGGRQSRQVFKTKAAVKRFLRTPVGQEGEGGRIVYTKQRPGRNPSRHAYRRNDRHLETAWTGRKADYVSPVGDYGDAGYSELAMHVGIAGKRVKQFALWSDKGRRPFVTWAHVKTADGKVTDGTPHEVLPPEVLRSLPGDYARPKLPRAGSNPYRSIPVKSARRRGPPIGSEKYQRWLSSKRRTGHLPYQIWGTWKVVGKKLHGFYGGRATRQKAARAAQLLANRFGHQMWITDAATRTVLDRFVPAGTKYVPWKNPHRMGAPYGDRLYEVIVGNIGSVYSGASLNAAESKFNEYVSQSKSGYGRAAGESVTLMVDGAIDREHSGSVEKNPRQSRRGRFHAKGSKVTWVAAAYSKNGVEAGQAIKLLQSRGFRASVHYNPGTGIRAIRVPSHDRKRARALLRKVFA